MRTKAPSHSDGKPIGTPCQLLTTKAIKRQRKSGRKNLPPSHGTMKAGLSPTVNQQIEAAVRADPSMSHDDIARITGVPLYFVLNHRFRKMKRAR